MNSSGVDESRDPQSVWNAFNSSFPSIMAAKQHEVESFLRKFNELLKSFPQVIASTSFWPDNDSHGSKRRRAFTLSFTRRLLQLAVKFRNPSLTHDLVKVANTIISTLYERDKVRWRRMMGSVLNFWQRLCSASQQAENNPDFVSETCEIFSPAESCEDEMFGDELNFIVITSDLGRVESVQSWCTELLSLQLEVIVEDGMLATIQRMCINQLELGEVDLKIGTLKLLAALHQVLGCGNLEMWIEESYYIVQMIELLTSGDLKELEIQAIESQWVKCVEILESVMKEEHFHILSNSLLPAWNDLSESDGYKRRSLPFLSCVRRLLYKCVQLEQATDQVRTWALDKNPLDMSVLGSLTTTELVKSESWKNRGGEEKLILPLLSPSWQALTVEVESNLDNYESLDLFFSVIEKLMHELLKLDPNIEIQILSKSVLELVTREVARRLGAEADCRLLQTLETLVKVGRLWPAADSLDPDLATLHHSWAALLSLPWLQKQNQKSFDLRPGDIKEVFRGDVCNNWDEATKGRALELLGHLPRDVCPKWRLSVAKLAWAERCPGAVTSLPGLIANTGLASGLAHDVIQHITATGRGEELELVRRLAAVSREYVCCVARRGGTRLVATEAGCQLRIVCPDCEAAAGPPPKTPRTTSPGLQGREVEPLLKLIGHQDREVRLLMVSLLQPISVHSELSPEAANLWMTCMRDSDGEVRHAFANNIGWMLSAQSSTLTGGRVSSTIVSSLAELAPSAAAPVSAALLDSYVCTLVRALAAAPPVKVAESILDILLTLFLSSDTATRVATSVHALKTLQGAMVRHKKKIFSWSAKAMCAGDHHPREMLSNLLMICGSELSQEKLESNLHHLLPPVILNSVDPSTNYSTSGADQTLDMIASYLHQKSRVLLMEQFPSLFTYITIHANDNHHYRKCIDYLVAKTCKTLDELMPSNRIRILVELLTKYNFSKERITQSLSKCAVADASFKHTEKKKGTRSLPVTVVANYVSQNLMAVLASFTTSLSHKDTKLEDKLQILKSLNDLIPVLKHQNLESTKYALVDCVKIGTQLSSQHPHLEDVALSLWSSLVRTLEMSSIVALLPQIVCHLLPHLDSCPDKTLEIIKFILVDNVTQLEDQLKQFIFLPPLPQLDEIMKNIRGSETQLKDMIMHLMPCLKNESVDVRLQTLKTLSLLLEASMGALQGLVVCSDRTDPVIITLTHHLMAALSIREPEPQVRRLAGLCLGKVGPVDPGKLEFAVRLAGHEDVASRNKLLEVFSVGFCVELLQELVRAMASIRDPLIAENCAFSIQEVLKVYQINLKDKNHESFSWRVWRQLSEPTQEKLSPLFTSMYHQYSPATKMELSCPIFLTSTGTTYKDWLVNWFQFLIRKLRTNKTKSLFEACLPALKKDLNLAESLLPRLVIEVLSCGSDTENNNIVDIVMAEILEVVDRSGDVASGQENLASCVAGAVFSVLDFTALWLSAKSRHLLAATRKPESALRPEDIRAALEKSGEYCRVRDFMERMPHVGLANMSYNVNAHFRSAYHFDQYLKKEKVAKTDYVSSLQKLYTSLEEPDLVMGVAAIRESEPSLTDLVQLHRATGNYQDAVTCYSQLAGVPGREDAWGLVQCHLTVGQPSTAAALAASLAAGDEELAQQLAPLQVEAAWQLGQWQQLETAAQLHPATEWSWEVELGRVLLAARREEWASMRGLMEKLRGDLVESTSSLGSLAQGAYIRSYGNVSRLGMLNEVQAIADKFLLPSAKQISGAQSGATDLLSELSCRLTYAQNSWSVVEPILRLRRCCFQMARDRVRPHNPQLAERLDYEVGELWLRSARLARESGLHREAYSLLLETRKFKNIETFLEDAKLSWERHQGQAAINILRKGLEDHFPTMELALQAHSNDNRDVKARNRDLQNVFCQFKTKEKEIFNQGKLLLAKYLEESKSIGSDGVMDIYNQLKVLSKTDEEVYFQYARSVDKQIQKMTPEQKIQHVELIYHTCIAYIKSMASGPTHLHHCLPRMLTNWFECTDVIEKFLKTKGKDITLTAAVDNASNIMDRFFNTYKSWKHTIPDYFFLTALPQLVSRICHPHNKSFNLLSEILTRLLSGPYSQQTFWHMVSVSKNSDKERKSRCRQIFNDAMKTSNKLSVTLNDSMEFAKKVDELCDFKTDKGQKVASLRDIMKSLPALFSRPGASRIILPNQRNLLVTLPTVNASVHQHDPFPSGLVHIESIEDEVHIMQSLVQPKRITFRGSDGHLYSFLAKPKDDLRRDSRLMDYCYLLNKLFRKDNRARSRNLHIRTYSVIPTNETNGLIEWADNLKPLRGIIYQLHKEEGRHIHPRWANTFQCSEKAPLEDKKSGFLRCIEAQGGAIFSNWFTKNFTDPQSWFMARMSYVRSTAVMSMMGYIIGLGDRHLENINVDTTTGDTFHVDMNCLFNKGETLTVPEVVPFRLTHNMVDAFGPVGIEGPYRIACEISLRVMRDEKDVLMSMLRPFVSDPLVDWAKESKDRGDGGVDVGKVHLQRVEDRLSGIVTDPLEKKKKDKRKKTLLNHGLSVEGQVAHLISEATSVDNLAVMYWGWAPYL